MVLGNQSGIGGPEHSLAQSHPEAPEQDKRENTAGQPRKQRGCGEYERTDPDLTATTHSVGKVPGKRYGHRIEQIKQHGNQAHRTVRCPKMLLYIGQYDVKRLPVRLVQEEGDP